MEIYCYFSINKFILSMVFNVLSLGENSSTIVSEWPVPACAESITQEIPFANDCTAVFPQGKYIKNHAKKAYSMEIYCYFSINKFILSMVFNVLSLGENSSTIEKYHSLTIVLLFSPKESTLKTMLRINLLILK
jgi:hypothetical protein